MKKLSLIFLLLASASIFATQAHAQAIVIASPGVKADSLSKSELRDIFTGDSSNLKDGSQIKPVLLKQGATHEAFLAAYVGMSDMALLRGWRALLFAGQAAVPKSFDSEAAVVDYVAHTPGTIGYISTATPHEGVKVLTVR